MHAEPSPEKRPPVNYVFVDYENVPGIDLTMIGEKTVYLTLLLGVRQTKLGTELVEKLMAHAASVQLVRLESAGKNALDFTLAYYLGRAVQADPNAYFHVISKDTGFDPLIEHLKSRHIRAIRHPDGKTLTFSAPPKPLATASKPTANEPEDRLPEVVSHLRTHPENRPKARKTLMSHLKNHLGKPIPSEKEIDQLIKQLVKAGHITLSEKDTVTYHLK